MSKGLQRSLSRGPLQGRGLIKERIQLNSTDLIYNVQAIASGSGGGGANIFTLPEGNVFIVGAACSLNFRGNGSEANLVDTWSGDFSIGTAQAAAGELLTGARGDIIASTALAAATAEVSPTTRGAGGGIGIIDNTAADQALFLNTLIDASDQVDNTTVAIEARGFIDIAYFLLGDD